MKTKITLSMILIVCFTMLTFTSNTFAQDVLQSHLPEGAKARIGKGSINEIAYSPDGARLAVASSIGIWLYDTQTSQEIALLTEHTDWVFSVAFSPDGSTLATGSYDGTVLLWNLAPSEPPQLAEDVNGDAVVNILDLTFVAANPNPPNGDVCYGACPRFVCRERTTRTSTGYQARRDPGQTRGTTEPTGGGYRKLQFINMRPNFLKSV